MLGRIWSGYRAWPRSAHIVLTVLIGVITIGVLLAPKPDGKVEVRGIAAAAPTTVEVTTSSITELPQTTTTEAPTTVTTTAAPTTTRPPVATPPPPPPAPRTFAAAAPPPPPPPPRATSATSAPTSGDHPCSSEYEGACVPAGVEDVDCGGGSGNGPYYVYEKNFRSVGSDPYGLDADKDGYACES
jgi:hypothetical protein